MKKSNAGFTLVELLVVVLIIGILASVGVPQYFKAVEKSRVAEAKSMLGALGQAWKRYNEMNSTGPTNINYLDVSATKGTYFAAPVIVNGSNGQFRAVRSSSQIGAYNVLFQANTGNFTCEPAGGNCEGLIR